MPGRPSFVLTYSVEPNAPGGRYQSVFYDALGRVIQREESAVIDAAPTQRATTISYDRRGNAVQAYVPFPTADSLFDFTPVPGGTMATITEFDAQRRPTKVTNPDGSYRQIDHSIAWQTTSLDECFTAAGCTGGKTVERRDEFARVSEREIYEEPATLKGKTRFTYDALGQLLTTEQGDAAGWNDNTVISNTKVSYS